MVDPIPQRTWLGGFGALATTAALAGVAALPGAVAGLVVLLGWALLADVVALAIATVAIGALLSADAFVVPGPDMADGVPYVEQLAEFSGLGTVELISLGVLALALVPLLLGSTAGTDRPIVVALLTIVLTAGLVTIVMTPLLAGESVLVGAAVLAAVVATIAYGLHRYGLLVSGVLQHG